MPDQAGHMLQLLVRLKLILKFACWALIDIHDKTYHAVVPHCSACWTLNC